MTLPLDLKTVKLGPASTEPARMPRNQAERFAAALDRSSGKDRQQEPQAGLALEQPLSLARRLMIAEAALARSAGGEPKDPPGQASNDIDLPADPMLTPDAIEAGSGEPEAAEDAETLIDVRGDEAPAFVLAALTERPPARSPFAATRASSDAPRSAGATADPIGGNSEDVAAETGDGETADTGTVRREPASAKESAEPPTDRTARQENTPQRLALAPGVVVNMSEPQPQPSGPAPAAASFVADPAWSAYFREIDTMPGSQPVKSLRIQLSPVELGMVTAVVSFDSDGVKVEIRAQTAEAYRQLASDAESIARSLRSIGLDVASVTIVQQPAMDPRADGGGATGFGTPERSADSERRHNGPNGQPAASQEQEDDIGTGSVAGSGGHAGDGRYI